MWSPFSPPNVGVSLTRRCRRAGPNVSGREWVASSAAELKSPEPASPSGPLPARTARYGQSTRAGVGVGQTFAKVFTKVAGCGRKAESRQKLRAGRRVSGYSVVRASKILQVQAQKRPTPWRVRVVVVECVRVRAGSEARRGSDARVYPRRGILPPALADS